MEGKNCPRSLETKPKLLLSMWSPAADESSIEITSADMTYAQYKSVTESLASDMQRRYSILIRDVIAFLEAEERFLLIKSTPSIFERIAKSHIFARARTIEELQELLEQRVCTWFDIDSVTAIRCTIIQHSQRHQLRNLERQDDALISAYELHLSRYFMRCCFYRENESPSKEIVCRGVTSEISGFDMSNFIRKLQDVFYLPKMILGAMSINGELIFPLSDIPSLTVLTLGVHAGQWNLRDQYSRLEVIPYNCYVYS